WVPADGAVSYDVEVFEVDRTPLWRSTSSVPRVELPASIVRQLVAGKTVLWEVRARNAVNAVIAESGTQRFRVAVYGRLPKESVHGRSQLEPRSPSRTDKKRTI